MEKISENYLDSEIENKNYYKGKVATSSKREFDLSQNNSNISYSLTNENGTSLNEDTSLYLSKKDENILYGNDFTLNNRPFIVGNTRICLYIKNYPIISIGKNILAPLLLIAFMCLIYIYMFNYFYFSSSLILQKMFNYVFLLYMITHTLAILVNPGIPSFKYHKEVRNNLRENIINELDCSRCKICNLTYKLKDRISHCYECSICYHDYDHHCLWIGHCIGRYNKIYFILFAFSSIIFILICLNMILIKVLKLFYIH